MEVLCKVNVLGTSVSVIWQESIQAVDRLSGLRLALIVSFVGLYRVIVTGGITWDYLGFCELLFLAAACYILFLTSFVRKYNILTSVDNSTAELVASKVKTFTFPFVLWSCLSQPIYNCYSDFFYAGIDEGAVVQPSWSGYTLLYILGIMLFLLCLFINILPCLTNLFSPKNEESNKLNEENDQRGGKCAKETYSPKEEATIYSNYIRVRRFSARIAARTMRQTWLAGLDRVDSDEKE